MMPSVISSGAASLNGISWRKVRLGHYISSSISPLSVPPGTQVPVHLLNSGGSRACAIAGASCPDNIAVERARKKARTLAIVGSHVTEILIRENQNGQSISVRSGDILLIELSEKPTTGFRWNVKEADSRLLRLVSDDFSPPAGGGAGAGGIRIFHFVPSASGETTLALELSRAWEPATPRSQFRIHVSIH